MQHLQPNTTLQGGKYRKLRVSERHKNLFLNATVMLKWIAGNIVASVDAGKEKFTYAIIDKKSATGISGEGVFKSKGDVENFYQQFVSLHYS